MAPVGGAGEPPGHPISTIDDNRESSNLQKKNVPWGWVQREWAACHARAEKPKCLQAGSSLLQPRALAPCASPRQVRFLSTTKLN